MKDTVTLLPKIGRQFLPQGKLLNSNVNFGLTLKVGRRQFSIKLQVVVSISVKKPYHKKNFCWLFQERGYWQFCSLEIKRTLTNHNAAFCSAHQSKLST